MLQALLAHLDLVDKVVGCFVTAFTGVAHFALRYHRAALVREKAKNALKDSDIEFMLAVEAQYRTEEKERTGRDPRDRVRRIVKEKVIEVHEDGTQRRLTWSGLFTPGRVANRNAARGVRIMLRRFSANVDAMRDVK